ncbi:MAG: hypothetical protein I3270_02135 [Candidatus Moeniiplasma glomeromycotorum]|nr:hypothetical protein [Candidatus Moeniiplasma glomeromycotorum]MCE8162497.1 hypothetical protein [Candidatus Moeniiplasma glomeromycotorum]MCE8166424.1 hypothetical protein [Candidatus Moeniiplasma glomeromycotorum]MCE8166909.1 hypothetical protein [Candidatus Moeniiplasma glomeromycotorum]
MANEKLQQSIRASLEQTKQEWNDHLSGKKINALLTVAWKLHPERKTRVQQVLGWIDNALQTDSLESYQELYKQWNGDPDLNKYNAENDAGVNLSVFRDYLDEWVNPTPPAITPEQQAKLDNYGKLEAVMTEATKGLGINEEEAKNKTPEEIKQLIHDENAKNQQNKTKFNQEFPGLLDPSGKVDDNKLSEIKKGVEKVKPLEDLIQATGINPQSENAKEEAKILKKAMEDLTEAGIKKNKVKESIIKYNDALDSVSSEYLVQVQAEIKQL